MSGHLTEPQERLDSALRALSAYFDSHVEPNEPPCPCELCEQARAVFAAELPILLVGKHPKKPGGDTAPLHD